jgi:Domain of unknown function (DUF397)
MTGHSATSAFPVLPVDGWRTSSRCGPNGGNCVEVNLALGETMVGVRDTKPNESRVLMFGSAGWRSFVAVATGGGFRV